MVRKYLPRVIEAAALTLAGAVVVLHVIVFVWTVRHGLAVHRLTAGIGDTTFYDAHGKPWFRMDEQRRDVPLASISPALRNAVVAVEDHRFYRHGALDPQGLARAAFRDVRSGGVVEGGSTLTQQLARMVFHQRAHLGPQS